MLRRKLFIVLTIAVGSMELTSCGGEAARSAQPTHVQTGLAAPSPNKDTSQAAFAARPTHPPRKEFTREASLSTYHNPEAGISFRYPRNYSLEEGDVQESSFFLKRQEDLDIEQPGATLVATVLIPEDGYPNTTFEHGSLQLVANEAGSEKACREARLIGSSGNSPRTTTIQGIVFRWNEQKSETAGIKILERAYAGYSQATCYEFLLTVAAEQAPYPDAFKRPADTAKVMKQLEKIVSSAQIFTKSATPTGRKQRRGRRPLVITTSGTQARRCRLEAGQREVTALEGQIRELSRVAVVTDSLEHKF
jgi:hypothetical protein